MGDDTNQPKKGPMKSGRVVFIDQARAIALTMMMVGHTLDQFLGEPWRSESAYREYQFFRGITSALFLMVSGFSFVVASFKYWDDYTRFSPRFLARMRRIAYIMLFAYLLHMYAGTLNLLFERYTPFKITQFLRFDVLQNIGLSLLLVHMVPLVVRKREHFWKAVLVLLVMVVGVAYFTYRPSVDSQLPVWLAPAVNMRHFSRFPLVPYTGFMLAGAFFAYFFWSQKEKGTEWKAIAAMMVTGVGLILFEHIIRNFYYGDFFPYASETTREMAPDWMPDRFRIQTMVAGIGAGGETIKTAVATPFIKYALPGNTFVRCGCAMLVISALYFLEKKVVILPRFSLTMSKDSLAIFVVQQLVIYSGTLGILHAYKKDMAPTYAFTYLVVLVALMLGTAYLINKVRTKYPAEVTRFRRAAILGWLFMFLLWPEFRWYTALVSMAVAVFFMYGGYKKSVSWILGILPGNGGKPGEKEPGAD